MRRRCPRPSRSVGLILCSALALSSCSGGSDSTGPTGTQGQFKLTARIDGAAWSSNAGAETAGVAYSTPGLYVIGGTQLSGYSIFITLTNIGGTGTYPLGVGPSVAGGSVVMSNTSGGWTTPLSGAAGTITIATLTTDHISGTFSFTANGSSGTATGTRAVTDGQFDLQIRASGTVAPVPANAGSKMSATLGGAAWNGATVAAQLTSGQSLLVITGTNDTRGLSITLAGISGAGTYALSNGTPTRQLGVTGTAVPVQAWSSVASGSSGSVTITSLTSTRIQGTFNATIGSAAGFPNTGTLSVASGTFSVGFTIPPT